MSSAMNHRKRSHRSENNRSGLYAAVGCSAYHSRTGTLRRNTGVLSALMNWVKSKMKIGHPNKRKDPVAAERK